LNKPITLDRKSNDGLPTEKGRSKSPAIVERKSGDVERPRNKSPGGTRPFSSAATNIPKPDVGSPTVRTLNNGSKPIISPQSLFSPKSDGNAMSTTGPLKRSGSTLQPTKSLPTALPNIPSKRFNSTTEVRKSTSGGKGMPTSASLMNGQDDKDEEEAVTKKGSWSHKYILIITRFAKVLSAFPFVIIVATLDLSTSYSMLRSAFMVRCMNLMIYVLPVVFVSLILSKTSNRAFQTVAMDSI